MSGFKDVKPLSGIPGRLGSRGNLFFFFKNSSSSLPCLFRRLLDNPIGMPIGDFKMTWVIIGFLSLHCCNQHRDQNAAISPLGRRRIVVECSEATLASISFAPTNFGCLCAWACGSLYIVQCYVGAMHQQTCLHPVASQELKKARFACVFLQVGFFLSVTSCRRSCRFISYLCFRSSFPLFQPFSLFTCLSISTFWDFGCYAYFLLYPFMYM